jgi:hypothetical protein
LTDGAATRPTKAFDFFVRNYSEALRRRGGDSAVGGKLHGGFLAAGILAPDVGLVQPWWTAGVAKILAWSTLGASANATCGNCSHLQKLHDI